MLRVYACILQEHDLRLVAVAGLICLLAALTSFSMLQQARVNGRRRTWIAAAGFGFTADRLDLEVTEGLLIKDPEGALAILRQQGHGRPNLHG